MPKFLSSKKASLAIIGGLFLLAAASGLHFQSQPYRYVVVGEPTIKCENGKTYPALPNGIKNIVDLYDYLKDGRDSPSAIQEDRKAKMLCEYGIINDYFPFRKTPKTVNYALYPGTQTATIDRVSGNGLILSKD